MRITLFVDGMRTVHCRQAVFTALAGVAGVRGADVSLGRVVLDHEGGVTEAALRDAVTRVGYSVTRIVEERRQLPLHAVE